MAKKSKGDKEPQPWFPNPADVRGALWTTPMTAEMRFACGVGAAMLGYMAYTYMPKVSDKILPILISALTPPPGWRSVPFQPYHPEAREAIETRIDERQLGRSEVIREIANPKRN